MKTWYFWSLDESGRDEFERLASLPDHGVLTKPDDTPLSGMSNVGVVLRYQPAANYAGPDQIVFLVRDQTEASVPAAVSLTITPVNDAPRFTSTAPLAVAEDTELVYDAEAVDVEGSALTYALKASPPSMRLDVTTGVIRWTPTNADVGVHTVSIEVTDAERLSATQTFSIRVENRNDLPEFTSTPITRGYPGVQYSYLAKATDPDRNETALLRFAATAGPTGLTVDRLSGEVKFRSTATGRGSSDFDEDVLYRELDESQWREFARASAVEGGPAGWNSGGPNLNRTGQRGQQCAQ